jgi:2-oxo-4-hydroxy-4-carboxy-5-ureidoimidazoline decarboxylase
MSHDRALARLERLDIDRLAAELHRCFGSSRWALGVARRAPFTGREALVETMESEWENLPRDEWLAALRAHPRIGEAGAESRFAATRLWSRDEQSGMSGVDPRTSSTLARLQSEYEAKFGHRFLICASGKSGKEILAAIQVRLQNDPEKELAIAAEELRKIATLRLQKLLDEMDSAPSPEFRP